MKLFGIPVKIEGSFFVLTLFLASGRLSEPALLVEWLLVVLVSILLHELGHAFAGRAFGLSPEITLYSMGGLTSWRGGGELSPSKNVAVSLAGPFSGFLFGALVYLSRPLLPGVQTSALAYTALRDLLWVNVGWGLFNLLPILPLDGGQALQSVERGVLRRKEQWITPVVSLLFAVAVTAWVFSEKFLWAAFLGGWFTISNGGALFRRLQGRRERGLHAPLAEATEAYNRQEFARAAALAGDVLKRAKTDDLRRHASRLLVFSLVLLGDSAAAEKELRRHQVFFGDDPYLEGFALLKSGRPEEAVRHLRAAFDSSPSKDAGLALYHALVQSREFGGAWDLCSHPALSEARWSMYVNLQTEAFNGGAFKISARAGRDAFRERAEPWVAYNVACAYARDGDGEQGLAWLSAAVAAGFDDLEALASDTDLDALRGLDGFERIREKFPPVAPAPG